LFEAFSKKKKKEANKDKVILKNDKKDLKESYRS